MPKWTCGENPFFCFSDLLHGITGEKKRCDTDDEKVFRTWKPSHKHRGAIKMSERTFHVCFVNRAPLLTLSASVSSSLMLLFLTLYIFIGELKWRCRAKAGQARPKTIKQIRAGGNIYIYIFFRQTFNRRERSCIFINVSICIYA